MPKFRHTQLVYNVIHFELIFSMLLKFRQPWYFDIFKLHQKTKFVSQSAKYRHLSQLWSKVIQIYGQLLENRLPKFNGTVEKCNIHNVLPLGVKLQLVRDFLKVLRLHKVYTYEHRNNMNMGSGTQEQHHQRP